MSHPDDKIFESFIPDHKPVGTLRCTVEGDELIIRISAASLAFAAQYLSDDADEMHYLKVHDPAMLLRDVAKELCRDDDGGVTMIEQLFDTAIIAAAEDGSQAFADPYPRDHDDLDAPELLEGESDGVRPDR